MSNEKTTSILERLPKILAVTAASYGIDPHARPAAQSNDRRRHGKAHHGHHRNKRGAAVEA